MRCYLAYNLCLRDLKETMAKRGLTIDHSTPLDSIDLIQMMRKHQGRFAFNPRPAHAEYLNMIAAS